LLELAVDVACLGLLLLALWAPADLLLRALGTRAPAMAREVPSAVALGMGSWSLVLFALAACGALVRPALLAIFALGAAWGGARLAARLVRWRGEVGDGRRPGTWWWIAAPGLVAGAAALEAASYPTIGWDDATYHLRLPSLYLLRGGFAAPRFSIFAHWPQSMEMLYALALAIRGPALAKLLHAACGLLLTIAAYRLARRAAPPLASLGVVLLLAASPLVAEEARFAYVDLAVSLFFLLALGAVLWALEGLESRRHLVLAGVFLGLATSAKLTAWMGVGALCVLVGSVLLRRGEARRIPAATAAVLVPAIALALPWHVKSWLETGNPVYPLLYGVFGGADWSADLASRAAAWQKGLGMGRSPADFLLLPFRVFFFGGKGYSRFDGALGSYWFAVASFAAWAGRRQAIARQALFAASALFILWALGPQQARFLLPALAPCAVAAAVAAGELVPRFPRARADLIFTACAALLLLIGLAPRLADTARQIRSRIEVTDLAARLEPPALAFLETQTPTEARVLFLNNNRVYPLTREAIADSMFEASQIAEWLRPATTVDEVRELLAREGVTHVLLERVDWGIDWPPALLQLLEDGGRTRQVFATRDGRFAVYELTRR
jgi:hypothetical protein